MMIIVTCFMYIYIYTHTHIHVHMHIYIYTYTYAYMHIYIYTHTYTYTCVYIYIYICIHTYIYMSPHVDVFAPALHAEIFQTPMFRGAPLLSCGMALFQRQMINRSLALRMQDLGFPSGIIRQSWNDTEKICMAPAQG